ncbi:MAG: 3-deoxy-manno-octulosonate cytidylyltransferase [Pyrinomonadaceae bacterium]|nr:3-deoxy-manno-octulosonate cytidylyltransferase [Pyrinomonadaceae bacterium]
MTVIIPARYASTRLPGKMLLTVGDKPLIVNTLRQAEKAALVSRVIVATDDKRIYDAVTVNGGEAVMTSPGHATGSDRIAEVAAGLPEGTVIINVQGDEPIISPRTIDRAAEAILSGENIDIVTTCERIDDLRDILSPDVVKVVTDRDGFALYFSRSPIPFPREAVNRSGSIEAARSQDSELVGSFRKHTGIYVYRREFLLELCRLPQTVLEKTEMLEQLRALENGFRIKVVEVEDRSIGVDTPEDLERVRRMVELNG